MSKLVVLSLGNGGLLNGFPAVTAHLWEPENPHPMKFRGSLPAAPELFQLYKAWKLLYESLYQRLDLSFRLEIEETGVTHVSEVEFSDLCQQLTTSINDWLNSETFRPIDQQLRTQLDRVEEIRLIIETNDNQVQRLPWHLWQLVEDYPKVEIALGAVEYQRIPKTINQQPKTQVKILAILGNSKDIDLSKDRAFLEQLVGNAKTQFLVEPQREQLNDHLWEEGWDILFFAGHSSSQEQGRIYLNQSESLSLEQLRYALKKAISRGLKLAVFNSCDGLGLAQSLCDLQIPQVIVMREPVPDRVAQEFLRHFLIAFSRGESLYAAVRNARERLQRLEGNYPCATWLPVICQNPAEKPTTWHELCGGCQPQVKPLPAPPPPPRNRSLKSVALISLAITAVVMGLRHLGILQPWELQTYDQLLRVRPSEGLDQRLLVVKITEADYQKLGEYPLSDQTVVRLLKKLEQYQPQVIGLDLYRDIPQGKGRADLIQHFKTSDRLIGVCKIADQNDSGFKPAPGIPQEHLGFSDVVLDRDQILRRHLLINIPPTASGCTTNYSLSLQLAYRYLEAKGISAKFTPENDLQLGSVIFKRLKTPSGSYRKFDAGGYQVLLNYRSPLDIAPQVTITDVLNGQIKPSFVKGRIVLIGVDTDGVDRFFTPYSASQEFQPTVAGVILQAQMVSQILSAVLDQRPLVQPWSGWQDVLWIWSWSFLGGLVVWRFRSSISLGIVISLLVLLYVVCFNLLKKGIWIPLVPSALTLVGTYGSVEAYTAYRRKTISVDIGTVL